MINQKIEVAINRQINHEMAAAYNYLAMAAYLERRDLAGFAKWMLMQRDEELTHAMRLFTYLLDRGGCVDLAAVQKPQADFDSVQAVFAKALEQERANTASIHELYALAIKLDDYATQSHLKWFLDEQVEEEKIMGEALTHLELVGDDKAALLVLNQQMGQRPAEVGG